MRDAAAGTKDYHKFIPEELNSRQKNIIAALSIVAGFVIFSCTAYGIHRYQQNKAENEIRAGQIATTRMISPMNG